MKALLKTFILFVTPIAIGMISCGNETKTEKQAVTNTDTIPKKDTVDGFVETAATFVPCANDSMKELAMIISGKNYEGAKVLPKFFASADFKVFAENFDKKWNSYDTSRIKRLVEFREKELVPNVGTTKKLFYPFSGPDILYGYTFFPEADEYVMLGLEPVGTLPIYDVKSQSPDSMDAYYKMVNSSLLAILKYSFFRTKAMKTDLKNQELDGTLHLLFLFLTRTGNTICSAKPLYIDTTGSLQYVASFPKLQGKKCLNKGIEIVFNSPDNKTKKLYYFSLNIADGAVKSNKGMLAYLKNLGEVNTYLKGASYLMHETYFSVIRDAILEHSQHVIQDDSGIAFKYFEKNGSWNYKFYGTYTRPIPMFSYAYQKDLDSIYKAQGSKPIGFGIGYNFKDKNSNFMIATKTK
ncbi:MAG: hypothetical protein K0S33_2328 [Bacteroidetes bacterium]|jgi:hypothetical protein|nr:hypothetical protein [Bacteroidota bacterium]